MKIELLNKENGKYVYWYNGYKYDIFKRPHGGYCIQIFKHKRLIFSEGYHTKALPNLVLVRKRIAKFIEINDLKQEMNNN